MKKKIRMGLWVWPALLGIGGAGLLSGCQTTEPVREYSVQQYDTDGTGGQLEAVGESSTVITRRYEPDMRPIGRVYDSTTGNFERRAPYGPNTPTSPSVWW